MKDDDTAMLDLIPEYELIVRCIQRGSTQENSQRIRSLVRMDVNWADTLRIANRHGVVPLLYHRLSSQFRASIPVSVLHKFRDFYLASVTRNVSLTRELLRLSALLRLSGIPCIAFKGPVLASTVYGDVGLRRFDDLDILVRREQITEAKGLLHKEGFHLALPVPPGQEAFFLRLQYYHSFLRSDGKVRIDMHWAPTLPYLSFMNDIEKLWERSRNVLVENKEIRTLSPKDHLLLLCEHGCRHCWERLSWIADVAGLVSTHPSLNLTELVSAREKCGGRRMVSLGLCLASDLLGLPLSEDVTELISQDHLIKPLASQVHRRLFAGEEPSAEVFQPGLNAFYREAMVRTRDQIMPYLAASLIPTQFDFNLFPVPDALFFLYFLLRPLRLITRYATGLRSC
jgi:hypothetical protein